MNTSAHNFPCLLPKHMRPIFLITDVHVQCWRLNPESICTIASVMAKIRCPCGGDELELLHAGNVSQHGDPYPIPVQTQDHDVFVIYTRCPLCSREWQIFDSDRHGYNAIVNPVMGSTTRPQVQLFPWKCARCSSTKHKALARIEYSLEESSVEDFSAAMAALALSVEEFVLEVFGYLGISTLCTNCLKETPDLISVETM